MKLRRNSSVKNTLGNPMVVYNLIQSTVCTIGIYFFLPILISRVRHIPVYAVNYFFSELINLFLKIGSFLHFDGRSRYTTGQTGT